jgi:hypothetical protein
MDGLALSINAIIMRWIFNLAKSIIEYFRLDNRQMNQIINEVIEAVSS